MTPTSANVTVYVYPTRTKLLSGLDALRQQQPNQLNLYYIVGHGSATWGAVLDVRNTNLPPVYVMNALGGDPLPGAPAMGTETPPTETAPPTARPTTTDGYGRRTVLDRHAVETTIEQQAGFTGVVCNHGVDPEVEIGGQFTCTADGGKMVTVTINSADGNYTWRPS
jgi:hypothetical protein